MERQTGAATSRRFLAVQRAVSDAGGVRVSGCRSNLCPRPVRTKIIRAAACLGASRNGPTAHLAGLQLNAFNETVIRPLLQSLDELVVSNNTG